MSSRLDKETPRRMDLRTRTDGSVLSVLEMGGGRCSLLLACELRPFEL